MLSHGVLSMYSMITRLVTNNKTKIMQPIFSFVFPPPSYQGNNTKNMFFDILCTSIKPHDDAYVQQSKDSMNE